MSIYRCTACSGFVTEPVPWSGETLCLGCAAGDGEELIKLSATAATAADPALSVHRSTRTARLADVARVYFGGNAEMARGWRDAAGQVSDPALYARQMRPFYALLAPPPLK